MYHVFIRSALHSLLEVMLMEFIGSTDS